MTMDHWKLCKGYLDKQVPLVTMEEAMKSAGFNWATVNGEWERGFECSLFTPNDSDEYDLWWIKNVCDFPRFVGIKRVQIDGWLSPHGAYGHMGMAPYECYALEIKEL